MRCNGTSLHNGCHFFCSRDSFKVSEEKCAKLVGGRNEGCHRVHGAEAVRMGTVTFTVTPKVTSSDLQTIPVIWKKAEARVDR
jgi:hypothetical protein